MTPLMMILKRKQQQEDGVIRRPEALAPLMEGPTPEAFDNAAKREGRWGSSLHWIYEQLLNRTPSMSRVPSFSSKARSGHANTSSSAPYKRSDLHLLLGILSTPLAPVSVDMEALPCLSLKSIPMETSSAQYIVQQYVCATGLTKLSCVRNFYAMGRVKMVASEFETAAQVVKTRGSDRCAETGCFVLWQMMPNMWTVEMAVGGSKVHAGSDGKLVWRHMPWLGAHAAKGPFRPLRRALQGLDPRTIANMFSGARCIGEKRVRGDDCFILKVAADSATLAARGEGHVEIVRHVLFGYFSQRTGLLVQVEDSHLTRIQAAGGGDAIFWETSMETAVGDYRVVDGISIAHAGRTAATLFRFGEAPMSHTRTRLEEDWAIDEVAFNVPGLSPDLFIPPAEIRSTSANASPLACLPAPGPEAGGRHVIGCSQVAALGRPQETLDNIIWRVEM